MASKKSKVLAIAFCAAVMSGIYVNPVLAAEIPVNNGSVTVGYKDFETTTGYEEDSQVTITNIASQDEVKQAQQTAEDAATLAGDALSTAKGETADRKKADADLQDQIDGHTNQIDSMGDQLDDLKANDEKQDGTLANHQEQLDEHKGAIESLNGDVSGLIANDAVQDETLADHQEQLDAHDISIKNHEAVMGVTDKTGLESAYEGATYIDKNDTMVEADRKLDAAISDVNSRVDGIENRVDGLEDRIDKVGAMSAAIANLRTMGYDPAAPTEVAVGVGQYRDETGMALGLFHYPNRDFMLSLSVSTSGDEYMGGIGATWKFGRKSPEKVAEIKKAQAEADARRAEEQKLAKAEEMKKAAKEAKVQAQMERHAKMLAEQEAQA